MDITRKQPGALELTYSTQSLGKRGDRTSLYMLLYLLEGYITLHQDTRCLSILFIVRLIFHITKTMIIPRCMSWKHNY